MVQERTVSRCWSVDGFERFWSNPDRDPRVAAEVMTDDIVGYWAGAEPVRGKADYTRCITSLMAALPDLRLSVAEFAVSEDFVFIRWIMHATGTHGPFEFTGIDRVRLRNGQVCENIVAMDTAAFQVCSGKPVPWA